VNNTATNSNIGAGIHLSSSSNNNITGNNASNNYKGMNLDGSSNNIKNNIVNSNKQDGIYIRGSSNNMINNTANDNGGYGIGLTSQYRVYSWYNNIVNNTLKNNGAEGIKLYLSCDYNLISNNTVNNNSHGIVIYASSNNTISDNNVSDNNNGIYIHFFGGDSYNNTIAGNTVNNNTGSGIILSYRSGNNTITGNIAGNSTYGIRLAGSINNTITDNIAKNNTYGIHLKVSSFIPSNNNTITGNIASYNDYGIYISSSSGNLIYNNIFNNTVNAEFYNPNRNRWNVSKTVGVNIIGGSYLGGNYWAHPNGTGFSQTCADGDGDGICDAPHTLDVNNTDYLPLTMFEVLESIVYIQPSYQEALVGSNFSVDVVVDPRGAEVYAGEYKVYFDATRLEAISQSQGWFLSQDGNSSIVVVNNINNTAGFVEYGETRIATASGVSAPGVLATLLFHVKNTSAGNATLNLSDVLLVDPLLLPIPAVEEDGVVNITTNQPPVADCGPDKLSCENVGTPVQFDGSASFDPDGTIVSYQWDFGDGNTGSGVAPKHTYTTYNWNGTGYTPFTVTLKVTDDKGATDTDTQFVVIWIAGDANGDGRVNIIDAATVGLNWGSTDPCADLNNDGKVNIIDAATIGLNWGDTA
jgi:parallel beta-helix repeat protein